MPTSRRHKAALLSALSVVLMSLPSLYAQATFTFSSEVVTGTSIGATELTGAVSLTVVSGTSVLSPFAIQFSAPITNNSAAEVNLLGTGGLAGISAHPNVDQASNTIVFNVPAGGVGGNTITLSGVRVSLTGLGSPTVTASISSPSSTGNAILAGQNSVTVISTIVTQPFTVDETAQPLRWQNGTVTTPTTSLVIGETYQTAFSSAVGTYGQTDPTQFEINPFLSIPAGVHITFAAHATSPESGALLTTSSGLAETIPRTDGSTRVTYSFFSAPTSGATEETFPIAISVTLDNGLTISGTIAFQATLKPIGIAVPNEAYPSTQIPRYSLLTLPADTDLVSGTVELAFPFRAQSSNTYTGIAMTNPQEFQIAVTLSAYDSAGTLLSGTGVSNPVTMTIPARAQLGKLATEIFGANFNAGAAGVIRALGKTSILPGFYLLGDSGGSRLDGAVADLSKSLVWTWPAIFHQGAAPSTVLELFNPGSVAANTTLRLYNSAGTQLSSAAVLVPPNGSTASDVTAVFPSVDLSSFTGGYVSGRSDVQVVARETFGNELDNNVLFAQSGVQRGTFQVAHFAVGSGYTTELNIVNADPSILAQITLTAFDNSGTPLAIAGNPKTVSINPGNQLIQSMTDLYPALAGATLTTGYVRLDVAQFQLGPFSSTPIILGFVRFSAAGGYASASLPLFLPPSADFIYSHIAQNLGYYTGVALLNTNTTAATVAVEVRDKGGSLVGTYTTTLQPGQKIAKLVYEMVPASLGQIGGDVHVRSSLPLTSFALFGTNDGKSLAAIPPQTVEE